MFVTASRFKLVESERDEARAEAAKYRDKFRKAISDLADTQDRLAKFTGPRARDAKGHFVSDKS